MKYSFKNTLSTADGVYLGLVSLKQGSEKKTLEKKTLFHVPALRDGGLCIFKIFYLFIISFLLWLCWVFVAVCKASSGGWLGCTDFSLWGLVSLQSMGSGQRAQQLQLTGLVTLGHVESACWTHIPCTGRQIPNHWTTREVRGLCIWKHLRVNILWPFNRESQLGRWAM